MISPLPVRCGAALGFVFLETPGRSQKRPSPSSASHNRRKQDGRASPSLFSYFPAVTSRGICCPPFRHVHEMRCVWPTSVGGARIATANPLFWFASQRRFLLICFDFVFCPASGTMAMCPSRWGSIEWLRTLGRGGVSGAKRVPVARDLPFFPPFLSLALANLRRVSFAGRRVGFAFPQLNTSELVSFSQPSTPHATTVALRFDPVCPASASLDLQSGKRGKGRVFVCIECRYIPPYH